jgi:hypothetical protein
MEYKLTHLNARGSIAWSGIENMPVSGLLIREVPEFYTMISPG